MEEPRTGWRDAWLPALLVVLGAAELASLGTRGWYVAVGLEAVAGVLLVLRRRHPLGVGTLASAAMLAIPVGRAADGRGRDADPLRRPGDLLARAVDP